MQNHFKTFQIISKSQLNKRCGVSWKPNHMPQLKLTPNILAAAVIGFEAQKVAIEGKIAEIRLMLDGDRSEASAPAEIREPRKKRSAAVRRKMALAQRARWSTIKQVSGPQPAGSSKSTVLAPTAGPGSAARPMLAVNNSATDEIRADETIPNCNSESDATNKSPSLVSHFLSSACLNHLRTLT